MVAAVEGGEVVEACAHQAVRASGGEAGQDGETQCAAHHERGVDDSRSQPGVLRRNVTQSGQQHRVEGHARAQSKQSHAWEHICGEVPTNGCPCEEGKADRGQQQPQRERHPDPETGDEPGREAE